MKVSPEWLADHALRSTKTGWEGPRWRFPAELKALSTPTTLKKEDC